MLLSLARLLSFCARKGRQPSKCPTLQVEHLEERALFAVTASLAGGTLTVTGNSAADNCAIGINANSMLDVIDHTTNTTSTFDPALVTTISVNLNDGNDKLVLDATNGDPVPSGGLTYNGGIGTNTLVGPSVSSSYNITGADTGNLNSTTSFSNVQRLQGGADNDTFNMKAGGSLSDTLTGGAGTDTLNYSTFGSAVSVNLDTLAATAINGGAASGFTMDSFVGSSGSDTLADSGTWTITGANAGTATSHLFSSFENLTGGTGVDTFTFNDNSSLSGVLDPGAGNDVVTLGLNVTLGTTLSGNTGIDRLIGPDAVTTWNVTAADAGNLSGGGTAVTFTSFERLQGGADVDTFNMKTGGSLSDTLTGGAGTDTLSYSTFGSAVSVNLDTFAATAINGGAASGFTMDSFVGSSGSDTLADSGTWTITGANAGTATSHLFSSFENLTGGTGVDTFTFNDNSSLSGVLDPGAGNDVVTLGLNVTLGTTLSGNTGIDRLVGPDAVTTWNVTAADAGNLSGGGTAVTFTSFERLQGGTNDDTFNMRAGGSLSDTLTGGSGTDTLSYSTFGSAVSVNLDTLAATAINGGAASGFTMNNFVGSSASDTLTHNGNWTITGANAGTAGSIPFSSFENLTGGASANVFTVHAGGSVSGTIDGSSGADTVTYAAVSAPTTVSLALLVSVETLTGGTGSDTLVGVNAASTWNVTGTHAGNVAGVAFTSFETLQGGTGNDIYVFDTDNPLGDITINGGNGIDTLDFSASALAVSVNLSVTTAQVINSHLTLAIPSVTVENVIAGSGNDSLTGNSLNNSLNGQAGNDIYSFDTDKALGNDTISEFSGTDTLTFAATTTKSVAINLGVATAQAVNSNLTLSLGSASALEYVVGGTLNDTLTGNSRNNILNGQAGNDSYAFDADNVLGNDTISESTGIDTLTFAATTAKNVAINLGIATAQVVNSNLTLTLASSSTMDYVVGGTLDDKLTGNNLNNILNGQTGNDTYFFDTDSALGNDTISESGVGTDAVNFSNTITKAVAVNLGIGTAQVVNSNLTLTLGSTSTMENVVGGTLNDSITGNGLNNTFSGLPGNDTYFFDTDSAQGNDSINESGGIDTLDFSATTTQGVAVNLALGTTQVVNSNLTLTLGSESAIENVVGGTLDDKLTGNSLNNILNGQTGNDIYFFDTDSALGNDTIAESGVGIDTLAFGGTTTKSVTVNLGVATAQVVNSNLKLTLGSASTMENVLGGSLNDILTGNSLNNVLSGNAGNDSISGGDGRDILLGGAGADTLSGGNDEDVLLGALYSQANNVPVLIKLMSEWSRTDLAYQQRIDHLTGANMVGANNDPFYLTTTGSPTVTNDGTIDTETGDAALDWFFSHSGEDNVTDASGETVTAIP